MIPNIKPDNKIVAILLTALLLFGCGGISKTVKRNIYFKLPLEQPEYHWVFTDRAKFLKNTTLQLDVFKSKAKKVLIHSHMVINNGVLSADWEPIDDDNYKNDNQIYFGFQSVAQYEVDRNSYVSLALRTKVDLEGIGADVTGFLSKNEYQAYGRFSIFDEDKYDAGKEENVYLEKAELKPNWALSITKYSGWLSTSNDDKQTEEEEELIPLFIPSLSAILTAAEREKGFALTKQEVLDIRDNSKTIMTPLSIIEALEKKRGYKDINPENIWNEWQLLRRDTVENANKNEKEAVVIDGPAENPGMRQAESKAKQTLKSFKALIVKHKNYNAMIKVKLQDDETSARMWLIVDQVNANSFNAHLFEVPSYFTKHKAKDQFKVKNSDVLDWMINVDGDVFGAYTIREQRKSMNKQEKEKMDEFMGVTRFQ